MFHILQLETPCEMYNGVTKNKPFIYEDNTELRNKDFSNLFTQVLALPPKDTKKAAFSTLCSDLLDYCCHRHLRSPSKKKHTLLSLKKKNKTHRIFICSVFPRAPLYNFSHKRTTKFRTCIIF